MHKSWLFNFCFSLLKICLLKRLRMCNFQWNWFPIKNLLVTNLHAPILTVFTVACSHSIIFLPWLLYDLFYACPSVLKYQCVHYAQRVYSLTNYIQFLCTQHLHYILFIVKCFTTCFHPCLFNLIRVYYTPCRTYMQLWCSIMVHG